MSIQGCGVANHTQSAKTYDKCDAIHDASRVKQGEHSPIASCKGKLPTPLLLVASAPLLSNSWSVEAWPHLAARWSGVSAVSMVTLLMLQPWLMRNFRMSS